MLCLQAQRGVELYSFCRRLLLRQNYRRRQGEQAFVLFAKKITDTLWVSVISLESGSCLSSHAVSSTVLSVYKGLTSVFGMRTGGSP